MTHSTVTSKGQVTIPASIREALELNRGDRLVWTLTEGGLSATVERVAHVQDVRGRLKHAARSGLTRAEERAAAETAWGRDS